jgi:hypothetical protein
MIIDHAYNLLLKIVEQLELAQLQLANDVLLTQMSNKEDKQLWNKLKI